jgi:hypothetical protein
MAQTIVEGTIRRGGTPASGAYVQVLDPQGAFTGERRTGPDGAYRFHLVAGRWSLVAFAAGGARAERAVTLADGDAVRVDLDLGSEGA